MVSYDILTRLIDKLFGHMFPLTKWGKIDWEKINNKIDIQYDILRIIPALVELQGNIIEVRSDDSITVGTIKAKNGLSL